MSDPNATTMISTLEPPRGPLQPPDAGPVSIVEKLGELDDAVDAVHAEVTRLGEDLHAVLREGVVEATVETGEVATPVRRSPMEARLEDLHSRIEGAAGRLRDLRMDCAL